MVWIETCVVIRCVTTLTSVRRVVIVPSDMTKGAIIGNGNMRPSKWVNRVVVKSGGYPGSF